MYKVLPSFLEKHYNIITGIVLVRWYTPHVHIVTKVTTHSIHAVTGRETTSQLFQLSGFTLKGENHILAHLALTMLLYSNMTDLFAMVWWTSSWPNHYITRRSHACAIVVCHFYLPVLPFYHGRVCPRILQCYKNLNSYWTTQQNSSKWILVAQHSDIG